jgi:hypothetical protein
LDQDTYINQKLDEFESIIGPNLSLKVATPLTTNFQELLIEANESTEKEPKFPYREMVGSLVYLSNGTRFDIAAAVSIVSRFMNDPKKIHCDMVRRIYHYLRGNRKSLKFKLGGEIILKGGCDASWANAEDYSSIAGYYFKLGSSLISWQSYKQPVKALSTAESEYIALTSAFQEGIWLRQFLESIGYKQETTKIQEDNRACIFMAKNPQDKKRTRHIQVKYHWVRDQIENREFELEYVNTKDQLADIFTKGFLGPQLRDNCNKLGLVPNKHICYNTDSKKSGGEQNKVK